MQNIRETASKIQNISRTAWLFPKRYMKYPQFIMDSVDKSTLVAYLYTDCNKAFEKMNHNIPLSKLPEVVIFLTDHKWSTLTVFGQTPLQLIPKDHIWKHCFS